MLEIAQYGTHSSVEESTLALEALLADISSIHSQQPVTKGLAWIIDRVEKDRFRENSVVGFYFAKLWYHEKLYPLTFTVSALGKAQQLINDDGELNTAD